MSSADQYDLLAEDLDWLQQFNTTRKPQQPQINEDELETLIDLFEKEAGKITVRKETLSLEEKIDPTREFPLVSAVVLAATKLNLRGNGIVEAVYKYWLEKRKRLGKALMRAFQEPPPKLNSDPHVAFRPRAEGRRISKRNPRKDDTSSYQKMQVLKRDFQRLMDICELMMARENAKLQGLLIDIQTFDEKLANSALVNRIQKEHGNGMNVKEMLYTARQQWRLAAPLSFHSSVYKPFTPAEPHLPKLLGYLLSSLPLNTFSKEASDAAKKKNKRPLLPPPVSGSNIIKLQRPPLVNKSGFLSNDIRNKSIKGQKFRPGSGNLSSDLPSMSPASEESDEGDGLDLSSVLLDRELYLSEDEEDTAFFQDLEEFVKRVKLNQGHDKIQRAPGVIYQKGDLVMAVSQLASQAARAAAEAELSLVAPDSIPSAIRGRARPVAGRNGRIWIDQFDYHTQSLQGVKTYQVPDKSSSSADPIEGSSETIKLEFTGADLVTDEMLGIMQSDSIDQDKMKLTE
jgi:hypothetical protein